MRIEYRLNLKIKIPIFNYRINCDSWKTDNNTTSFFYLKYVIIIILLLKKKGTKLMYQYCHFSEGIGFIY